MDEGNVHQLWGFSPALDLLAVREEIPESLQETTTTSKPSEIFRSLQVCPNDCRHTVTTLCRTSRHLSEGTDSEGIEIVVYEECIENLARHILLVLVLLDENLSVRDRVETFLELHGNVFIQEKTEAYLEALGKRLERFVSNYPRDSAIEKLYGVFDLSQLNYKERDALVEVFRGYRSDGKYSLEKGWESRLRNFYGDRFDFKKNMIDWDYHMRLCRRGCCGQANEGGKNDGSIVHFYHFREWRSSGVAYEFRDCVYKRPNRSLLTTTIGKSIFCKDRSLQDVGKTVSAKGYWGDVANSPYHCFGAVCEDQSFFKKSNRQFMKTAVDVAEFNVEAMIDELRTGRRFSTQQQKEETPAASESKPPPLDSQQSTSQVEKTEEIAPPESPNPEEPLQGQSPPDSHPESGQKEVDPAATEPPSTSALKEKENQCGKENKDGATTTNQGSALSDREAILNESAWDRCKRSKIVLLTGDLKKKITGKKKFESAFDVITVGCHNVHFAWEKWELKRVAKKNCVCLIESAKYLLHLKEEQVEAFTSKVSDSTDGFERLPDKFKGVLDGALDAHLPFLATS